MDYAFALAGADNLAAIDVQSEQFGLSVNDVGSPSGAFDGAKVNEYMDECQSVTAGSTVDCMDYAFALAGADNLAAIDVQSEQFALSVNDVGSPSGAFDGVKVNEYMAECQSVMKGSVVECLDYAFDFAAPSVE
jgi:hypothetical protein